MAERERGERGREGYGNDVMKVYEGGTVAAAPAAALKEEKDVKKAPRAKVFLYTTPLAPSPFSPSLSL